MIIAGLGVILFGIGNGGHPVGISNLWTHGGFFTGGFKGFCFALSIVLGSYQGVELLGITAGEAENPRPTIVKAVKDTIGRILIFYVGAIFVIVAIYPWNQLSTLGSPFVQTFAKIGITFAASLINFVVITAALSGSNSGIYSASRMLYTLADAKQLPRIFTKLNRHGVPFYPVIAVGGGILLGVILNALLPHIAPAAKNVFVLVYSSSVLPGMVPWIVILVSEIRFRKVHADQMANHPFKMPFAPYSNYLTLIFLAFTLFFMLLNPETSVSLLVGVVFLGLVVLHYLLYQRRKPATQPVKANRQ